MHARTALDTVAARCTVPSNQADIEQQDAIGELVVAFAGAWALADLRDIAQGATDFTDPPVDGDDAVEVDRAAERVAAGVRYYMTFRRVPSFQSFHPVAPATN